MNNEEQAILQKHLASFIIRDVFNLVTEEDILKVTGPNVWEHQGRDLLPEEVKRLKDEAMLFAESKLWKILVAELRYHAQKAMLEKSKTESDMIAAKMLIYLTNTINERLKKMTE